jgi:hypothetical protein
MTIEPQISATTKTAKSPIYMNAQIIELSLKVNPYLTTQKSTSKTKSSQGTDKYS